MERLIYRDEALLLITDLPIDSTDAETLQRCIEVISNMPTVDAVPVVRCKDCKYWTIYGSNGGACELWECQGFSTDDYCSSGKRKDGDADGV